MNMNVDPSTRTFFWKPRLFAAAALLTLVAACTNNTSPGGKGAPAKSVKPQPKPPVATCSYERGDLWTKTPRNTDMQLYADILGVSRADVAAGLAGPVHCDPGVPVEVLDKNEGVVTVNDIPAQLRLENKCLAFVSDVRHTPGAVSPHPIVVCPKLVQNS